MGKEFFTFLETVVLLIVTVAIVALVVSPKATTSQVIQASASGLANNLGVAEAPVTGASYNVVLSYPNETPWSNSPFG